MENLIRNISGIYFNRFIYPAYYLKYGYSYVYNLIKIKKLVNKYQWLSQEDLINLQSEKLKSIVNHVYNNVPFYSKQMRKLNIRPEDIKSVEDIKLFPILTKKDIKENYSDLLSDDRAKRKYLQASTGGSTGEPLKYIRDNNSLVWTEATQLRGMSWAKYKLGDKIIDFMSAENPTLLGIIRSRLKKYYFFPPLSKEIEILAHMKTIKKLKPYGLTGYASNLYRIACICFKHNINDISFEAIFPTSEMLYDYQRDFIEKQFKGKVFDYYGCSEVGSIAFECEFHSKHVSNERLIVEIDITKQNEILGIPGEIVVTDLDNYVMPFIRYKPGDFASLNTNKCMCGRGLTRIESLEGRSQDYLVTIDDNYVSSVVIPNRFKELKGIDQYQIIQKSKRDTTLKIVKNKFFSQTEVEYMVNTIRELIGQDVNVEVETQSHIPLSKSGKNRLVISWISMNSHMQELTRGDNRQ